MTGNVFVTQGDITEFQADAVVCPTSTHLSGDGFAAAAFERRFPEFGNAYKTIRQQHPVAHEDGQRLKIGDAFWIPVGDTADRLRGIVLVAVTGGQESIAEWARRSVQNALRTARVHLRTLQPTPPAGRWLIALPTLGLGMGGFSRQLQTACEAMVRAAHEEVQAPEPVGGEPVGGEPVAIDVAFVAFNTLNYRLLLDARSSVGAEPACPLESPMSRDLLQDIGQRRCVLFAGAGLSRGAGLPDWSGLLHDLANELRLDLATLARGAGGQLPLDLCLDLAQWYVDRFDRESLDHRIHELFGSTAKRRPAVRPTLAHYLLAAMPFRLFLTTNYDDLFERTLKALRRDPEVVVSAAQVVRTGQAERPCVVKLHGDATEETPIVLTRDDFDTFFRDHPVTTALLQGLLLNHTFLFVGYDLRDPNTRQIFSSVAHLLGQTGARAYSVVVRAEDSTSKFYEDQWRRQGLVTLRMPGADRIHASLQFFDWLARQTCELHTFLHPDLQQNEAPPELQDLAELRQHLGKVAEQVALAVSHGLGPSDSPDRVQVLAAALDLVTRLGWRPTSKKGGQGFRLWEALADASGHPPEKVPLLRRALRAAEGLDELDRLRAKIAAIAPQRHQDGRAAAPDKSIEPAMDE